jgi:lysylphosphatidylglycerol synthetase-like protein (DUF2156 family)
MVIPQTIKQLATRVGARLHTSSVARQPFESTLDRIDCGTLEQARRTASHRGHALQGLGWAERVTGTGLVVAALAIGSVPLAAGAAVAGLALGLHSRRTLKHGRHMLEFATDVEDYSKALGKPAAQVSKQEALQRRGDVTAAERAHAAAIVHAHGRNSMARMVLFDDKSYVFTPGGSVVAYGVSGRTAVALGDPVGPPQDTPAAIDAFLKHCKRHHWKPVFCNITAEHGAAYRAAGFDMLGLGDEAVVNVKDFTLAGGKNQKLRSTVNKLTKAGYTAEVVAAPPSDELLGELREVSDEWLRSMHGKEKQFALGAFDDEYMRSGPVLVVRDDGGKVCAFTNLIPRYAHNELTIDLMRRRNDVANGTMDFLFTNLFTWAREQGYDTVNLGLSPLSGVGEKPGATVPEKLVHAGYEHLNRFYNFKGLHAFKSKFGPDWSPRYLAYAGAGHLPAAGLALIHLTSGDHFIADCVQELAERLRHKKQP